MEVNHDRVLGVAESTAMRGDSVSIGSNTQNGQGTSGIGPGGADIESASSSHRSAHECQSNKTTIPNTDLNAWTMSTDPTKINKLREIVECSTSVTSKCLVDKILQQVGQLTDIEKLNLYLKLPGGRSPEYDPLKQPLNPLGNRSEIGVTINWVSTHLKPNPEVSIPKKEIYTLYHRYCSNSKIKPLNTADFGKVMKQVFPDVNPRRLGNRGKSRYCYSGLGINDNLNPPMLPDLSDCCPSFFDKKMSDLDIMMDKSDNTRACGSIILEWADKHHKIKCTNLKDLALNFLKNKMVNSRSPAANFILSCDQNLGDPSGSHRDVSLQLQKTIQEREKRKHQENITSNKNFPDCTKTRKRSDTLTRNLSGEGANTAKGVSTSKSSSQEIKSQRSYTGTATTSFHERDSNSNYPISSNGRNAINTTSDAINNNNSCATKNSKTFKCLVTHPKDVKKGSVSDSKVPPNYIKQEDNPRPCVKVETEVHEGHAKINGNVPSLRRSQDTREEGGINANINDNNLNGYNPGSKNLRPIPKCDGLNRYKPIQPKETNENLALNNSGPLKFSVTALNNNDINALNSINNNVCSNSFPENISIPSNDSKTLHGPSKVSIPYQSLPFNQAAPINPESEEDLRKCLSLVIPGRFYPISHSEDLQIDPNLAKTCLSFQSSETSDMFELNAALSRTNETNIPQSSTTLVKSYDFTPISANVGSCMNMNQVVSQCSSGNGSPFTSPTRTPLTRSRNNSGQTSSTYLMSSSAPFTPDNSSIGNINSECSTAFVSPATTPLYSRSRHNSTPYATNRSRNLSGALSCRLNPYPDEGFIRKAHKYARSRDVSGNISAPLSPLIHDTTQYSQESPLLSCAVFSMLKKETSVSSICNDRKRHISSPANYFPQPPHQNQQLHHQDVPQQPPPSYISVNVHGDPLGQEELTNVFNNYQGLPNSSSSGPSNRPQSVPLPQMLNSSCSNEFRSYPTTPNVNYQFNFQSDCISHSSSFSATPVPSENFDYDGSFDKDPVLATLGTDCPGGNENALGGLEAHNPMNASSEMVSGFSDEYPLPPHNSYMTTYTLSPVEEGFNQSSTRSGCPSGPTVVNNTMLDLGVGSTIDCVSSQNVLLSGNPQTPLSALDSVHGLEGPYDHSAPIEDLPSTFPDLGGQDFSSVLE